MRNALVAAVAVVAVSAGGCRDRDSEPEAQQLARINKQIALLGEKVDALGQRIDRLEAAAAPPPASPGPARDAGAERPVATVVVAATGAVAVDGEPIAAGDLAERIAARAPPGAGPSAVSIRTEPGTPHARVVEIVDLLRRGGITDIAIDPP